MFSHWCEKTLRSMLSWLTSQAQKLRSTSAIRISRMRSSGMRVTVRLRIYYREEMRMQTMDS